MLGNIEGRRRRVHQRMRWLEDITDAMDINLGKLREMMRDTILTGDGERGFSESDMTGQLNNKQITLNKLKFKDD